VDPFEANAVGCELQQDCLPADRPPARGLDPRLLGVTTHCLEQLRAALIAELRARYELGNVIHLVRYAPRNQYGRRALTELARHLALHVSALRRIARVTETISPQELEWILGLPSPRNLPLSWSHLELLATVRLRSERESFAALAAARDLSVRALARELSQR
jgi:hypothetical protein